MQSYVQPHTLPIAPPSSLLGLREYNVNWPSFWLRIAIRGLLVWPIIRYAGGVQGARALGAAAAIGGTLTGLELAFDAAGILTLSMPAPNMIQNGLPSNGGSSSGPSENWTDPNGFVDVNGTVVGG